MTTPKEALELKPCPFCGKPPILLATHETDNYIREYEIRCDNCGIGMSEEYESSAAELWNTRALASLQGEDAVESVARIKSLLSSFHRNSCYPEAMTGELNDAAERILATGLVPDEAAIRADEREKCAKIAESDALHDQWPLHGSEMQAPSKRMQIAIAAAIRSNQAKP